MRLHRAESLFLALALLPAAGEAQVVFREVPGEREFTGVLIARPRSVEDWIALGRTAAVARGNVAEARRRMAAIGIRNHVPQTDESLLQVPPGRTEESIANELLDSGLFRYVEPDWRIFPIGCPNDADLASQWHHDPDRMDSCVGWDLHTGNPSVVVGYCDTGLLLSHDDLQLHRQEAYNAVDQVWESAGGQVGPIHPHGTWVTGCGSGNGDNSIGIAGVGWNLGHRMLRVSNSSSGSASLSVLQHAARTSIENGDRVASVSYSGVDTASNLSTASYIKSIGGLLVWAAGNDSRNLSFGDRDADDLIVVGATDENDNLASFSAYGVFVDVTAPGNNIYTTGDSADDDYDSVSGTSFSTPLTAGLIALLWSYAPTLTPDEVEDLLKTGCDDLGSAGLDSTFGYGRIDVAGTLSQMALQFSYPGGQPADVELTGGTSLQVDVLAGAVSPQAGSGLLHVDDGDGWRSVAMEDLAAGSFLATFPGLPGADCADPIAWYVTVVGSDGNTYSSPLGGAAAPFTAAGTHPGCAETTIVDLDFETAVGWSVNDISVTDGSWDRGIPVHGHRGDPDDDYDGSGQCWVTDNVSGNSDVDGGPTQLLSPVYDLRGWHTVELSYARWFNNDDRDGDRFDVDFSSDGGATWVTAESVGHFNGWVKVAKDVGSFVPLTSGFRVRFSATDNPNNSVTEAGLDAFRLVGVVKPLKFDITPEVVALDDAITADVWTGKPLAQMLIALTTLDGGPLFVPFVLANFDAAGRFSVADVVPNDPSLVGSDFTFTAWGFDPLGKLRMTNSQLVAVR
jgi:subtilisin family serine protease